MTINPALYSSQSDEWSTPQQFFDQLNEEFGFTLDPCASPAKYEMQDLLHKRARRFATGLGVSSCIL